MKIKQGYTLRGIADSFVVVPTEDNLALDGMVTFNESGAFLFNALSEEKTKEELLALMLKEYKVDEATAKADIEIFIERLTKTGIVE